MPIVTEYINNLIHTYSDSDFKIRKIGTDEIYVDAWDVIEHQYEETDIKIEEEEIIDADL